MCLRLFTCNLKILNLIFAYFLDISVCINVLKLVITVILLYLKITADICLLNKVIIKSLFIVLILEI